MKQFTNFKKVYYNDIFIYICSSNFNKMSAKHIFWSWTIQQISDLKFSIILSWVIFVVQSFEVESLNVESYSKLGPFLSWVFLSLIVRSWVFPSSVALSWVILSSVVWRSVNESMYTWTYSWILRLVSARLILAFIPYIL
jgi:hypothetical protein